MSQKSTISQMQKWNKRFKLSDDAKGVIDSFDGSEIWTVHPNEAYNLCILFNELHNENEKLRHTLSQQEMEYATDCNRLSEENNRLKQEIQKLKNQQ